MNLAIDIGNTFVKAGLFDNDKLVKKVVWKRISSGIISSFSRGHGGINDVIISDVTGKEERLRGMLRGIRNTVILSTKTPLPFVNRYETPATLGTDRIALVAGAMKYFQRKNVLVISAGTCITYDFIDSRKRYRGGSISPGLIMRFEALHKFTAKLPIVKPRQVKSFTGKSTRDSIATGVLNGMLYEMDGFIDEYKKKYNDVKVILTGGDAALFASRLKNSIFAAPELTLTGLNEILKHNAR
jgi:type III pantothenate kinase